MKNIVITISDKYLTELSSISESLRKDGFEISNVYEFGVLIGTVADENILNKLRKRKEIMALTEEKKVNIPPPDADIQ